MNYAIRDENGLFAGVDGEYRIQQVTVNGEPLDPEKAYTVASLDYVLMDHGDGQTAFDGGEVIAVAEETDMYILIHYIQETLNGVIGEEYANPYGQGRIVAVNAEEENEASPDEAGLPELPEGVVPVTWQPSPEHLMIDTEEARALYERIANEDYPTVEELKAHPVVAQLDALSAYYKALYGETVNDQSPERIALRKDVLSRFLTIGSARKVTDDDGKTYYVYDGELKKEFQFELVLGLSASGKSTLIVNPDSEAMGAFIMDPDMIKEMLPEYQESYGAAADAVHFEGMMIMEEAIREFLEGDMKGVNIILPIVSGDLDALLNDYIRPFEAAGYHVKVKFRPAKVNEAAARVIKRTLEGGQLINSYVVFMYGTQPEEVYYLLSTMINSDGEPYGYETEEEMIPAA